MALRYAAKVDENQQQIIDELRGYGYDVDCVHRLKKLYDLVVSGRRATDALACSVRVEVKRDSASLLTVDELEYWQTQRHKSCLIIARCASDVLEWFGDDVNLQIHKYGCTNCQ